MPTAKKAAGPSLVQPKPKPSESIAVTADGKQAHKSFDGQLVIGGALSIPIVVYTAAREVGFSFNMLHGVKRYKEDYPAQPKIGEPAHSAGDPVIGEDGEPVVCGSRVKQGSYYCPACDDVDVDRADIIKGFALDEKAGHYLHISKEELDACKPANGKMMEVIEFVDAAEVPALYFAASYYLSPDERLNRKMFNTLWAAMREKKVAAIAKVTNSSRQHYAFLLPVLQEGRPGMHVFYSYMSDEIQQITFPQGVDTNPAEVKVAGQVIDELRVKLDMGKYEDEYSRNVGAMLDAKQEGKEVPKIVERKAPAPEVDLMAAMKATLELAKQKKRA
jgi:DNA end-binding protein Ku